VDVVAVVIVAVVVVKPVVVEVEVEIGAEVEVGVIVVLVVVVGAGSPYASTQYDMPTSKPPQEAVIDGFYYDQYSSIKIERQGKTNPSPKIVKRDSPEIRNILAGSGAIVIHPPRAVRGGVGIIRELG
jgi:hypothetical protein